MMFICELRAEARGMDDLISVCSPWLLLGLGVMGVAVRVVSPRVEFGARRPADPR